MQTVKGYNLNLESRENTAKFTGELMEYIAAKQLEISLTEFPLEQARRRIKRLKIGERPAKSF
jgi:hypothetical protein